MSSVRLRILRGVAQRSLLCVVRCARLGCSLEWQGVHELNQENGLLAQMQNAIQKKDLLNNMGTKAYEDARIELVSNR